MHEWALADAIVRTALNVAQENEANKVLEIRVVLGELQDVDTELIEFAVKELIKGTIAENAKITFIEEEALFKCRNCSFEWKLKDIKESLDERIKEDIHFIPEVAHAFMKCPKCKSPDFDVVKGRGVYIEGIKVAKEE
jgi:hydrogenase nickel incorporation protein HypA/HybF